MAEVSCGFKDVAGGASGADLLTFYGPTIAVDIGFDPDWDPAKSGVPLAGMTGIAALVDTGATECCIDSVLATQLNLPVVDKRTMAGAHGAQDVNVHLAQVHVPGLHHVMWGQFCAVHLTAGGSAHKALIGRSFLSSFQLVYNGKTGAVSIKSE
jgi:predicted aspartyl protease